MRSTTGSSDNKRLQAGRERRAPETRRYATAFAGDREGQYAIAINDQWRICLRFGAGDAYDVEVADDH